jgi:hypothetical protein
VREPLSELGDPPLSRTPENASSLWACVHPDDSAVYRIRVAPDETRLLEAADNAGHGRGADLLRCGELAQCPGPAENEH